MHKIFGTDGVRGIANLELTTELLTKIGRAVALVLSPFGGKILIGKDTRISSDVLEYALVSGIASAGSNPVMLGVVPTPAVSFLTKSSQSNSAGVMISASHNSFEFNGIKIFNSEGYKLDDETQSRIEDLILNDFENVKVPVADKIGKIFYEKYYVNQYINHIKPILKDNDLKVVFDCANGTACRFVAKIFKNRKNFVSIFDSPNGLNINENCGSTNLASLSKFVINNGFDLGIAFDGDADRCLAVDENGEIIDGDHIIAALAIDTKKDGNLKHDTVIGTHMANMGLSEFLEKSKINFLQTKIGDRFISEKMNETGAVLGGEQSGHIICSEYSETGDGLITAVMLINLVSKIEKSSEITKMFKKYPQFTKNIKIEKEVDLLEDSRFKDLIKRLDKLLYDCGRVFVRKSGTEPLIRIMCEAKSFKKLKEAEKEIEDSLI
ncbi:MAG: phosphoglucosamine mutase [Firmicutes bacterium]|nr:phosphoglucosamine mutase [Bacillota bacterium]